MGPIFNKKVAKKCNLWDREQYTYTLFTVDKVNYCGLEKKKKKRKTWRRNVDVGFIANQTVTIHVKISVSRLFLVTVWFAMKPTSTFLLHVFFFFFFFSSLRWLTLSTMNSVYVYCLQSHKLYFLATFLLKMGPKTLFTHLKIISLQCFQFQFSVSAKISSIQTH